MIFSVVFEYTNDNGILHRRRCYVRASCPEKAREKVSNFFVQHINGSPNPTFSIKDCSVTLRVHYLIP